MDILLIRYDAHTFFPGLNNSIKYLAKTGLELHNYNYNDKYLEAVMEGMKEVHFQGLSVHIFNF